MLESPHRVVAKVAVRRGSSVLLSADRSFTWRSASDDAWWSFAERIQEQTSGDSLWSLPPALCSAIRHTEAAPPTVALLPLGTTPEFPNGAFGVVALRDLNAGDEVTRDAAPLRKRGGASRAATLLSLVPPLCWTQAADRDALEGGLARLPPPRFPAPRISAPSAPADAALLPSAPAPLRLHTDYALLAEVLSGDPRFELVASRTEAQALWLLAPLRTFPRAAAQPGSGVPLLLNQFPYEGCLVRKDLLPQTAQLAVAAAAAPGIVPPAFPPWFPPTFDLATEAHLWQRWHRDLCDGGGSSTGLGGPPVWIVKRATDSHSRDCALATTEAAVLRMGVAGDCDRIAQLYVARPRTVRGLKFDLRVYVLVRSFHPLCAYVDVGRIYARLAGAPYSGDPERLANFSEHFTVAFYGAGGDDVSALPAPGAPLPLMPRAELAATATAEGWSWAEAEGRLLQALYEAFSSAGQHFVGGPWPQCRALYGCDVMFDEGLQPKLLEVNFGPDLTSLHSRLPGGGAAGLAREAASLLFLGEEPSPSFVKLGPM